MNGIDAAPIREDPFPPETALPPEDPDPNETEPEENADAPASSLPAGEPEESEPPALPDEPATASRRWVANILSAPAIVASMMQRLRVFWAPREKVSLSASW